MTPRIRFDRGSRVIRVLIADDHASVREAIRAILSFEGDIMIAGEADDGPATLRLARELTPDAIVLDHSMPGLSGLDVARKLSAELPNTGIVFLTMDPLLRDVALAAGAQAFVLKDAPSSELVRAVRGVRAKARTRSPGRRERDRLYLGSVQMLAAALEAKEAGVFLGNGHVASLARRLADELGLGQQEGERIELAALLRDIGKLAVPEAILRKPAPLLAQERRRVAEHATIGADILRTSETLREVVPFVRHHHEFFDGSGYPDRIGGDAIPLGAQIVAVVDAFNAITSPRSYKPAFPAEFAVEQIKLGSGRQFAPRVVRGLVGLYEREPGLFAAPAVSRAKSSARPGASASAQPSPAAVAER